MLQIYMFCIRVWPRGGLNVWFQTENEEEKTNQLTKARKEERAV